MTVFNLVHIDNSIYPWIVVLILPINSVLNPFIYSIKGFNKYLKIRKGQRAEKRLSKVKKNF